MLLQLIKFRLTVTFRKSVIIVPVILFLLFLFLQHSFPISQSTLQAHYYEYATGGVIFFSLGFLLNNILAPFNIQKSDVDFLYVLPLDDKEIFISQLISSFLMSSIIQIIMVYFFFPFSVILFEAIALVVDLMSLFSYFAFKKYKYVVAPIITAWMFSSITKSPFTPLSMLFGYIYGYFILSGLLVIITYLGIRNVSIEDLINEFYKRQGLFMPKSKTTTSTSLNSPSPLVAMLKKDFYFVEIAGVMPYMINTKVKIYKVVGITSAIAIAIYAVFSFSSHTNSQFLSISESLTAFILGLFFILFTSSSAFMNEPLWLNLSVMTPIEYARKYLVTKTLSVFITFLPISISLFLLNPWLGFGSLFIPLVYIYTASIAARFNRASIIDIRVVTLAVITFVIAIILIFLDAFFPITGAIITLIFTLPFLFSKGYWEKTFEKIIISV